MTSMQSKFAHDLATETVSKHFKLYASDLPDLVYCDRLFYMKKTMDIPRRETFPMMRGTIEHEIRRTLAKSLKCEYEACSSLDSLQKLDYKTAIEGALDYGRELARKVRSAYYLQLEEIRPLLNYRLEIEEKNRLNLAVKMAKKDIDFEKIFSQILPWQYETGVGSTELGITGRVDQVYKINNFLIPLDFKTHYSRISALLWKESHFEQLAVYALLLEIKNPGYKVKKGIIKYTEDLHDQIFKITNKDKKNVIGHIKKAKTLIKKHQLPPKLSGEKAVRCRGCYLKPFCFSLEDEGETSC